MSTRAVVDALDFSNIRRRLISAEWPDSRVDTAINEYRRFLILASLGVRVVPCPDVDRIWHEHVLHTHQYSEDCIAVLGEFLHHTPSTGSIQEAESRSIAYQKMIVSYITVFNQNPPSIWGY
jgi:hypothetical protein